MNALTILFVTRASVPFHTYKSVIRELLYRGHSVFLLLDRKWASAADFGPFEEFSAQGGFPPEADGPRAYAFGEKKETSRFEYRFSKNRNDFWSAILFSVRQLLNYRRYFLVKGQSVYFRERLKKFFPRPVAFFLELPFAGAILKTNIAGTLLRSIENYIPADREILAEIQDIHPDVVVTSIGSMRYGSADTDYLKAASFLKIPTAVLTVTWDTLTTKGYLHIQPDILLAWNETHRKEAKEHHGISPEKVRIIGAPVFDAWFEKIFPSQSKEEFCRTHGILPDRPIITYLGSSRNMAEDETWLIEELRDAFDHSSHEEMRHVEIIIRPHPANAKIYDRLLSKKGIAIVPKGGEALKTKDALQLFYDTLYYSALACGINTSAMIETIIAGKPVISILSDKYHDTQIGAEHFRHLIDSNAIEVVSNFEAFVDAAKRIIEGEDLYKDRRRRFIETFIRPRGIDTSAGEIATQEIENIAKSSNTFSLL